MPINDTTTTAGIARAMAEQWGNPKLFLPSHAARESAGVISPPHG